MMNRRAIKAIVRKDILDILKSPHILFSLVLPIATLLLFRPVFYQSASNVLLVVVIDPGNSSFVRALDEAPLIDVVRVNSLEELQDSVQKNAVGGLILPSKSFDADLIAGEQPGLLLYTNTPSGAINFQRLIEQQLYTFADSPLPADIQSINVSAEMQTTPFRTPDYLLIMTLIMALAIVGISVVSSLLVEEKEKHTLKAILVMPINQAEIALGKALVGLFYSFLVTGSLFVLDQGWRGNWLLSITAIVSGAFFLVSVGVWLGCTLRTSGQLNAWGSAALLVLMLPSWLWVPFFTLPLPIETIFRFLPTHYLTATLRLSLAHEGTPTQIGTNLLILWGSTLLILAVTAWQLRHEQS